MRVKNITKNNIKSCGKEKAVLVTKEDIPMSKFGYDFVIPKGTKTTHMTACGYDENYNFVDDLSFIKNDPFIINGEPVPKYGLLHDMTYYGVNLKRNQLVETDDEVNRNTMPQ